MMCLEFRLLTYIHTNTHILTQLTKTKKQKIEAKIGKKLELFEAPERKVMAHLNEASTAQKIGFFSYSFSSSSFPPPSFLDLFFSFLTPSP